MNPFRELGTLQREMNRLFEGVRGAEYPAMNVAVNDQQALVTAEVPGIEPKSLDISVNGNTLTVEGERKAEEPKKDEKFLRRERGQGRFVRTIRLPFAVESNRVEAEVKNGVLQVRLPREEASKPRRIAIQGG